jgi:hypothetical protein
MVDGQHNANDAYTKAPFFVCIEEDCVRFLLMAEAAKDDSPVSINFLDMYSDLITAMTEDQALQMLDALVYAGVFQATDCFLYLIAGYNKRVAQMLELRLMDSMYQALMAEFASNLGLSDTLAAFEISKCTGRFSRVLTTAAPSGVDIAHWPVDSLVFAMARTFLQSMLHALAGVLVFARRLVKANITYKAGCLDGFALPDIDSVVASTNSPEDMLARLATD